jgi:hypothetical protein
MNKKFEIIKNGVNPRSYCILASYPPSSSNSQNLSREVNVNTKIWISFVKQVSELIHFRVSSVFFPWKPIEGKLNKSSITNPNEIIDSAFNKLEFIPKDPLEKSFDSLFLMIYF